LRRGPCPTQFQLYYRRQRFTTAKNVKLKPIEKSLARRKFFCRSSRASRHLPDLKIRLSGNTWVFFLWYQTTGFFNGQYQGETKPDGRVIHGRIGDTNVGPTLD